MSKILFVIPRMGGGGAERVTSVLAGGFIDCKDEVNIHTFIEGESFYPLKEGITQTDCGIKKVKKGAFRKLSLLLNFPKAYFKTKKLIRRGGFDAVISFLPEADLTLYLIKKSGVKFKWVCSERNDPWQKSKRLSRRLKKAYKIADLLIFQSENVKAFYSEVQEDKKAVIFNPVDADLLPERAKEIKKTVVGVGRLDKQKNFALLINSFIASGAKDKGYRLDVYGEGPERETLEKLIEEKNAGEYVTLRGADKEALNHVAEAELFVMSSDYEGFPNALLEAAAMGVPAICTDFKTETAREIIQKEFIVPVKDAEALTKSISEILSDQEKLTLAGGYNRKNAQKFYKDKIFVEWRDKINSLISETGE